MSDKEKKGFKWLEKFKNIKHIEIYIAVIFVVIVLLIYLSTTKKSTSKTTTNVTSSSEESYINSYVDDLENNLEEILGNIGGVTNVKVMITLKMNQFELVDSKLNITKFPDIQGVLITGKGLNNTSTKLKVLKAVEAVLEISNGKIEILSSD